MIICAKLLILSLLPATPKGGNTADGAKFHPRGGENGGKCITL